jgi:cation diffusion facilitator CzcD-associated flavoprotein CzcO
MTASAVMRDRSRQGGLPAGLKRGLTTGRDASPASNPDPENQRHNATRFCIIGAGPSGLAAAKNFKQAGIPFDRFEGCSDIGGLWNPASPHRAYETVHLNISKRYMQFTDFPIPSGWPDFLGPAQSHAYLKSYAKRFGLEDAITFNTRVTRVEKRDATWRVWTNDENEPRHYDGLIVANGHHWDARLPDHVTGADEGVIHAQAYKSPNQLRGKKVLVVGGGNSGLDIACDAARYAAESHHSLRRGYHIIPKLIFGRPTDRMLERLKSVGLSRWMVRRIAAGIMRLLVGPYDKYGLPKPTTPMFAEHPAASSQYLELLRHGEIRVRPDIAMVDGRSVRFTDGTEETFDLIIYCTGYRVSMPFLDDKLNADVRDRNKLFLNLFHRRDDSIFFVGLFQPADGGFWQLADYQAQLIAKYVAARDRNDRRAQRFRRFLEAGQCDVGRSGTATDLAQRNLYAVDHYRYRKAAKRLLKRLGPSAL